MTSGGGLIILNNWLTGIWLLISKYESGANSMAGSYATWIDLLVFLGA